MKIMISSMSRPGDPDAFPKSVEIRDSNIMLTFDDSNGDLFAPIPVGRGSGTGSPNTFETSPTPNGSNGGLIINNNASNEDPSKSFPHVLHAIVSDEGSDNCIHWLPCGTRFVIADKDDFSRDILPRYFGGRGGSTTKFTSFTRRLKRWNFSRVPSGREMGAYFHENFRRGEPELAKRIVYPVAKTPSASGATVAAAAGGGKGGGGGGSGGKKSVTPFAATSMVPPKARRRASTGSLIPIPRANTSEMTTDPFDQDLLDALDISPTPIRSSLTSSINVAIEGGSIPLPPVMENDVREWLATADLLDDQGNETCSTDAERASVVSNSSFLLPPPAFPSNNMMGGCQQFVPGVGMMKPMAMSMSGPVLLRPGLALRRHSVALENLNTSMPGMPSSSVVAMTMTSFPPPQLLGTNFSCSPLEPEAIGSGSNNDIAFPLNDVPTMVMQSSTYSQLTSQNESSLKPLQTSSGFDDSKETFDFAREFSFDDLKVIDPFT